METKDEAHSRTSECVAFPALSGNICKSKTTKTQHIQYTDTFAVTLSYYSAVSPARSAIQTVEQAQSHKKAFGQFFRPCALSLSLRTHCQIATECSCKCDFNRGYGFLTQRLIRLHADLPFPLLIPAQQHINAALPVGAVES